MTFMLFSCDGWFSGVAVREEGGNGEAIIDLFIEGINALG
jgi:hypothetical protein